jgi:hypothetical protein
MAEVRRRRGRIQLHLDSSERAALSGVLEQLAPLLGTVSRTSPSAYDDPDLEEEYQRWVRPAIDDGRRADLDVIRDCLGSGENVTPLTEAQALAWARGLNHLRLIAGGVLGIERDGWEENAAQTMQGASEYRVLMALGMLQEELVVALDS